MIPPITPSFLIKKSSCRGWATTSVSVAQLNWVGGYRTPDAAFRLPLRRKWLIAMAINHQTICRVTFPLKTMAAKLLRPSKGRTGVPMTRISAETLMDEGSTLIVICKPFALVSFNSPQGGRICLVEHHA
jgi:hypothetical protein